MDSTVRIDRKLKAVNTWENSILASRIFMSKKY